MPRLVKVANLGDVAPGQGGLVVAEGQDIALFNADGTHYALSAVCPHEEGPLQDGEVRGDTVICPWHAYAFNLKTGECSVEPALHVSTYTVAVVGNDIFIELP